jgi:hypothetical protein
MLAHDLVDRPIQDVDLFTPDPSEVTRLADAPLVALRAEGAQVRLGRREPEFSRLSVTVADERSVVVEVVHDARIREAVQAVILGRSFTPTRWPPTRLLRCSAVRPPATWWMWRRCLSGTRWKAAVRAGLENPAAMVMPSLRRPQEGPRASRYGSRSSPSTAL